MERVISKSPGETEEIACRYSKEVSPGEVICLEGNLGSGKTQFVRGFVKGFGIPSDRVDSPTFTIINEYDGKVPVFHFDCYRLDNVREAIEIGAEEYLYGSGVCIVEWPDRILRLIPPEAKFITLKIKGKNKREIIFHEK